MTAEHLKSPVRSFDQLGGTLETLVVDGQTLRIRFLTEISDRQTGLVGVDAIAPNQGILFVWDQTKLPDNPDPHLAPACIMSNMSFAIIAVFGDGQGKIVQVSPILEPESEPHLCPQPARWMLELHPDTLGSLKTSFQNNTQILDEATLAKYGLGA